MQVLSQNLQIGQDVQWTAYLVYRVVSLEVVTKSSGEKEVVIGFRNQRNETLYRSKHFGDYVTLKK